VAFARTAGRDRKGAAQADLAEVGVRLDAFWTWWRSASPRVAAAFDAGQGESIVDELSARIHAIDPHLAWDTGPGLRGARHHLALSSEGDLARRVLVERWLARAPAPDAAWEYYPARQATRSDPKVSLRLHDLADIEIEFAAARVAFETDAVRELVHVTLHHPAFAKLPERERTTTAFLVLDNVLGEDEVERWLGGMLSSVEPIPDGKPLAALAEAVAALAKTATGERFATAERRTPSGQPIMAVANLALKRVDHLLMDHHLEVVMPFREQGVQGLPTGAENDALNALEDELLDSLGHDAVFVGHETGDGRRTIHLHVAGQGPAEDRTREWARKHPERPVGIDVRHDPGWEVLQKWR
jgi:hypothetical protein